MKIKPDVFDDIATELIASIKVVREINLKSTEDDARRVESIVTFPLVKGGNKIPVPVPVGSILSVGRGAVVSVEAASASSTANKMTVTIEKVSNSEFYKPGEPLFDVAAFKELSYTSAGLAFDPDFIVIDKPHSPLSTIPTGLTVISANAGRGKSVLLRAIASEASEKGMAVAFASMGEPESILLGHVWQAYLSIVHAIAAGYQVVCIDSLTTLINSMDKNLRAGGLSREIDTVFRSLNMLGSIAGVAIVASVNPSSNVEADLDMLHSGAKGSANAAVKIVSGFAVPGSHSMMQMEIDTHRRYDRRNANGLIEVDLSGLPQSVAASTSPGSIGEEMQFDTATI